MEGPSIPKENPIIIYDDNSETTGPDIVPENIVDLPKWCKPTAANDLSTHTLDLSPDEPASEEGPRLEGTTHQESGAMEDPNPETEVPPGQYEADLSDRLRLLQQQVPRDSRPQIPQAFLASLAERIERSRKLLGWSATRKQRRRTRTAPSPTSRVPPCVRCFVKQMPCSLEYEDGPEDIVSCTRCARNGVPHCIRQVAAASQPSADRDDPLAVGTSKSAKCELSATLTPELVEAAEELLQGQLRDVCGMKLSADVCKGLVLPKWHDNDKPENQQDPEFRPRQWKEQLVDRRHEMLVAIQQKIKVLEGQLAKDE
ncbi:hypothetical protein UCRPA7_6347 [Phaeoacremonium minimum UCRPA7]|uniref:Uncharacterized protein n=1 Tax=Phaeoacremonium minimum (strain UCR-PA7) TaxID=1286976 RepID=R8BFL1_PHAM7|nr:hypothetical protein UCRPA7_6347 [Phaeoacremonium minimum UCRPA7]EON98088.1 hypothetical protein UCRPA7_6347 [Phaeoacremonium minimum UCRPA7]